MPSFRCRPRRFALWGAALLCVSLAARIARADTAPAAMPASVVLRDIALAEDRRDPLGGSLQEALSHPDPVVRARAALAIGRLQDSSDVAVLVAHLGIACRGPARGRVRVGADRASPCAGRARGRAA
jgi:hypothetical protein